MQIDKMRNAATEIENGLNKIKFDNTVNKTDFLQIQNGWNVIKSELDKYFADRAAASRNHSRAVQCKKYDDSRVETSEVELRRGRA